ncbi:GNAT family N-acetyltransferase [Bacillus sp. HMF5848]|uniref:GNAT family N-acetyltransferase n=1 Tax=Bacillus sp. HMF5848 TaxID=2495421 RepID=UPI000F781BCE|nr:GNAT family N-acetyltransferase [Bacillus sp. HMF5848]RSK26315.1 GNAT family N-acetyltransferase [Bacillus sp. HMF5848]
MIYKTSSEDLTPYMLEGFFVGWPDPPSSETHLHLLKNSWKVIVAIDETNGKVVGFISAISDGVLTAYIPLLEVLPTYKNKGIGTELVRRMLAELSDIYMIDLCCDDDLIGFYKNFGMHKSNGMIVRNYEMQSGKR